MILRQGNAGANTAVDHIEIIKAALAQLPSTEPRRRPGRKVLIRTDGAGGTHEFVKWVTGQRLQYSVGFTLTEIAHVLDLYDDQPGERGQLEYLISDIDQRRHALQAKRHDLDEALAELDALEQRCRDDLGRLPATPEPARKPRPAAR